MKKYRCTVCGYSHEGELSAEFICPVCKKPSSYFEETAEEISKVNKCAGTKTEKNLLEGFAGESQARNKYTYFAEVAAREGYHELSRQFARVAEVEKRHEARYRKLLENLKTGEVWQRTGPHRWMCRNCGYVYIGEKAPEVCPTCEHPRAFFELEAENY